MRYELSNTQIVGNAILRRYVQYLRLERSYTPNTLDAYLKDLQKLYQSFLSYIQDRFITTEETLELLTRAVEKLYMLNSFKNSPKTPGTIFCDNTYEILHSSSFADLYIPLRLLFMQTTTF